MPMRGTRRITKEEVTEAQKAAWREILRDMVHHTEQGDQSTVSISAKTVEPDTEEHMLVEWLKVYGLLRAFRKGRRAEQLWYVPTIKGVLFAGYPKDLARQLVNKWIDDNRHWIKTATNRSVVYGGEELSYVVGPKSSATHYFTNRSKLSRAYKSDDEDEGGSESD